VCARGERDEQLSTFLVERYWPGVRRQELEAAIARAARAVQKMRRDGTAIRHLRSTLVPADETVLCLFGAVAPGDVAELNRQAEFPFDRIVEVVALPTEGPESAGGEG
jgi:hypothetical protein